MRPTIAAGPDAVTAAAEGIAALRTGDILVSEIWCRRALVDQPWHFHVLHLLGVVQILRGRPLEAARRIGRALSVVNNFPPALANLARCMAETNQPDAAASCCRRALVLQPDLVDALGQLGGLLNGQADAEGALAQCDRALVVAPDHAEALKVRSIALISLKRPEEALASLERLLRFTPDDVGVLNNLGTVLEALRRTDEALASFRKAIALSPGLATTWNNLGQTARSFGRPAGEALSGFARALAISPRHGDARSNRANAWLSLGHLERAIADFEALVAIDPGWPFALGSTLTCRLHLSEWNALEQQAARISAEIGQGRRVIDPFSLFAVTHSDEEQSRCEEAFCRMAFPTSPAPLWRGERYDHGRMRIAYLSADFRDHAISHLLAGLFELHDRGHFEIFGIDFSPADDSPMRRRIVRAFEHLIDVRSLGDRDIAILLRRLEIDVAVDLMGHTTSSRLGVLAHRPAPVSVNFFCPTGAPFVDYLIADRIAIPDASRRFHRESIVYFPNSFLATDDARPIADDPPSRAEVGLPERGFVFCCLNANYKIVPAVFDVWMRLLNRIEDSVLWLRRAQPAATRNLRDEAARRGIDPARLVFAAHAPSMEDHLARYRRADLFLDTLPFNAHTTAVDALWAGLPVLTCLGSTFVGRVGASLLTAIGLPELVAKSLEEYESMALELARDCTRLADIRARLERNRATHPLFDSKRYGRTVENAYVVMLERARRGQPPQSFTVPDPNP